MTRLIDKPADCPRSIIYIFIDGIGLGLNNNEKNPFSRFDSHFFAPLGGATSFKEKGYMLETDAHMGIDGLPQSATGQTALFTGYNGPALVNRHINGYPTYTLRPYIKKYSLLKKMQEAGRKATLINAYSDIYLKRLEHPRRERMLSATSQMQISTGQPFLRLDDYREGRAMYMDITNWFLRKLGLKIDMQHPKEAGRRLARLGGQHDLVVYEYFFTDKVGHEQSMGAARRIIPHIDGLLEGLYEELDAENDLLIVSSDHGNMENLSVGTHTQGKVPTILYGKGAELIAENIHYLYDIPREILKLQGIGWKAELIEKEEKK